MKLCVFGAGYVGSITAAGLAELGHDVTLVEISAHKITHMQKGLPPIYEPDLLALWQKHWSKKLKATNNAGKAITQSDAALICVSTPSLADGLADCQQVRAVISDILQELTVAPKPYTIILRSTVPLPQLRRKVLPLLTAALQEQRLKELSFVINPEFLRQGSALKDFLHPPFVVAGIEDELGKQSIAKMYESIDAPIHYVEWGTASLLKYACNAFHAVKIAFANEIAAMAQCFEADSMDVWKVFCEDRLLNISEAYLKPGFSYGGSCLPKDLRALCRLADLQHVRLPLLQHTALSNHQPLNCILQAIDDWQIERATLVGITYKAGTDDLRESPYVELVKRLTGEGVQLKIYDPDVDMSQLHGQNKSYGQQHLWHFQQMQKDNWRDALEDTQLIIISKKLPHEEEVFYALPEHIKVLDLTRRLQPKDHLQLYQLAGNSAQAVKVKKQ